MENLMFKKIITLFKLGRKVAKSDILNITSKFQEPPLAIKILFKILSFSFKPRNPIDINKNEGERLSSSLGYSQAIKKTWELYKTETDNPLALRTRFKDSVMFIGWYINKTNKINKIPRNDSYRQYLNYYLGWGDYAKKVYKVDKKSVIFAKSVEKQSKIYKSQLRECQKSLDRNKYIIF